MACQEAFPAPPAADDSLVECALKVLQCPDPWQKAEYTYATVKLWREGIINRVRPVNWQHLRAPDRPARSDDEVRVCAPGEAPRRGKGGTVASRQALLHSAVHIENWAVDLSWDIVARFGLQPDEYDMPRQFFDDFVKVAEDECRHFTALAKRLEETGSYYGAFAVHDGLWESAANTAHSLPARLAVEHCVHEARGLDVLPSTIAKFANNGDKESAALLRDVIYPEEVSHCAAGVRWIRYLYDVAHGRQLPAEPADARAASSPASRPPSPPAGPGQATAPPGDGTLTASAAAADAAAQPPSRPRVDATEGSSPQREVAEAVAVADGSGDWKDPSSSCSGGSDGGKPRVGGMPAASTPSWVLDALKYGTVEEWFHSLVRAHFWGGLKPPFNADARARAGFGPEWYMPLAAQSKDPQQQQQQQQQLSVGDSG